MRRVKRLIELLRVFGPADAGLIALSRVGFFSRFRALDIFVDDRLRDFTAEHDGLQGFKDTELVSLTFRELRIGDLPGIRFADGLLNGEEIERRLAKGSRLFAALSGSTMIAQSWVNCHRASLRQLMWPAITLPKGVAYLHGTITAPTFQRKGIGTALSHMRRRQLQQEGYWAVVCAVEPRNRVSRRWHMADGFRWWGRIRCVRWSDKDYWWYRLTEVGRQYADLFQNR